MLSHAGRWFYSDIVGLIKNSRGKLILRFDTAFVFFGAFSNAILQTRARRSYDLAVVKLKAPKKIALSATITSKVGNFSVSIQNRGPQTEMIPNLATLRNLVTVAVELFGTNCVSFAATLLPPKAA